MSLVMVMVLAGEVRVESRLFVIAGQVRLEPVMSPFSTPGGGGGGYNTSARSCGKKLVVEKQSSGAADPVEGGEGRV